MVYFQWFTVLLFAKQFLDMEEHLSGTAGKTVCFKHYDHYSKPRPCNFLEKTYTAIAEPHYSIIAYFFATSFKINVRLRLFIKDPERSNCLHAQFRLSCKLGTALILGQQFLRRVLNILGFWKQKLQRRLYTQTAHLFMLHVQWQTLKTFWSFVALDKD